MKLGETKEIKVTSIQLGERYVAPKEAEIGQMARSFKEVGQLSPIVVTHVTQKTYRIVAGATRYKAASLLKWDKIRAEILHGSDLDCRIHELAENLDRRNLTKEQRREIRAKYKAATAERLALVQPSVGGRGNKGGLRQAAREAGIPRSTAQDHQNKVAGNDGSRPVSDPAAAAPNGGEARKPASDDHGRCCISVKWTSGEDARFEAYRKERTFDSRAYCARAILNKYLDGWSSAKAGVVEMVPHPSGTPAPVTGVNAADGHFKEA